MNADNFGYGYIPDAPDSRDFKFKTSLEEFPLSVDLSDQFFPIRQQGVMSSCTAFATTSMVEFVRNKQRLNPWQVSPLFTYYATRKVSNSNTDSDGGAYVRDALKSAANYGVTKEEIWPYDLNGYSINPPTSAWEDAENHQALTYYRIEPIKENILGCLSEGYPFVFGAYLYESFANTQTGFVIYNHLPLPDTTTEKMIGGHCMTAVGYTSSSDTGVHIKVRNSWGEYVGLGGYHYMPLEYFTDPKLSIDFWTIRTEEYTTDEVIPEPVIVPPTPAPVESVVDEKPIVTPAYVIPDEPKVSIWKKPFTYIVIGFIIVAIMFASL